MAVRYSAMVRPRPELEHLSDFVADDASPCESGTRRKSSSTLDNLGDEERERDSQRPTLRIQRSIGLAGNIDPTLDKDGAPVDVSPTQPTLSDLVAMLGPKPAFDAMPTQRSIVLPIAPPAQHAERTRRDSVTIEAPSIVPSDERITPVWDARPAPPSAPAAAPFEAPLPPLHATPTLIRSRPGPRRLITPRNMLAVAVAATLGFMPVVVGIVRSGSSSGPADVAGAAPAPSEIPPAGSSVQSAASEAPPLKLQVEPTLDAPTAPDRPVAHSDRAAKPAAAGATRAPAAARPQRAPRTPAKLSNDVDFGI